MTQPMTQPLSQPPNQPLSQPLAVRRPPEPLTGWASVTQLSPATRSTHPDDVPVAATQGTLALELDGLPAQAPSLAPSLAPAPAPSPGLRLVEDASRSRTEREVHQWAARFAQATVEVLGGDRPLPQLVRLTSTRVYQDLERRARLLARIGPADQRRRTIRPQVRSVHVCLPTEHCAEVSVHVRYGPRSRAVAARIEHRNGRWVCTALQMG